MEEYTKDVIQRTLATDLSPREFEEFVAELLRAVGYQARVTSFVGDGGVDVIAHRDPLGLEPPIIKVQCKRTLATIGRPQVQGLVGALGHGELGLFVTLGTYSGEAFATERERANLRLLSGRNVVELVLEHYERLAEPWKARIPLRSVYAVDRGTDSS